jgi:hypothetical protein
MIQIEVYNAATKRDLEARERYWLEALGATLNRQVPTRTQQEYLEENKEKEKERKKKWCEENKEKDKERKKKWHEENKEKEKERNKKWREENKEKRNATNRNWRAKQFAMKLYTFIQKKTQCRYRADPLVRSGKCWQRWCQHCHRTTFQDENNEIKKKLVLPVAGYSYKHPKRLCVRIKKKFEHADVQ